MCEQLFWNFEKTFLDVLNLLTSNTLLRQEDGSVYY